MQLFKLYLYLAMKPIHNFFVFSLVFLLFACGNDDGPGPITSASVTVQFSQSSSFDIEGDFDSLPMLFLDGNVESASSVTVVLGSSSTATGNGSDFNFASPLVINIPVGTYDGTENTAIPLAGLTIIDDAEEEETETIELTLTDPTGDAVLGSRESTVYSILDNDSLSVSFLRAIASGSESNTDNLPKLLVTGSVTEEIVVTITDDGSGNATVGLDYDFQSPQDITIPVGSYDGSEQSQLSIPTLQIIDDDLVEETEFFELSLSAQDESILRFTNTRYEITGIATCENGSAQGFPCNGYDFLGRISLNEFGSSAGNDVWGWTDPANGDEYALVGLDDGTAFVDVSGDEPIYLGKLPTATGASTWRDVKVYADHAFIVSEAGGHGMQVFSLGQLRNVNNPPVTFNASTRYTGFGNAHNIVINEEMGYAYPVGTARSDTFNGGVHFIDIQNPLSPTLVGGYGANGYTHDAQVVTYIGPDSDYSGREIFIGSNETQIAIVDITDKSNPSEIATLSYAQLGYTHQGWFTEDQRYFILGDELDEANFGFNSRTLVFDLTDLDAPNLHTTYTGPTPAIDHNGYVLGNEYFLANYTAGIRVLDISQIENEVIQEIGFFDTFPADDRTDFEGAWSVYPYLPSGKILVNDINSGLFIIRKSN